MHYVEYFTYGFYNVKPTRSYRIMGTLIISIIVKRQNNILTTDFRLLNIYTA